MNFLKKMAGGNIRFTFECRRPTSHAAASSEKEEQSIGRKEKFGHKKGSDTSSLSLGRAGVSRWNFQREGSTFFTSGSTQKATVVGI